jgi:tripartite-type tricarboxylate transporter receptor subunit TctC
MRRFYLAAALLSLAFGTVAGIELVCAPALAQDKYPSKPVKIVVPYAPGGATDIVARILGEQLRAILGQSIIVENKPGANGIVAIGEMVSSRPDGYTLMIGNVTTNAITPVLTPAKVPNYDKNVVPVTNVVDIPAFLLVTTTNFTVKSVAELVDYARKNPGKLRYGTVGAGSYPHYDMAFFAKKAGDLDMIAIHNKAGAAGIINDMITGDSQASFLNAASSAAQIKAGKLRPLAVVNHRRLPEFPDVATMQEVGYPDAPLPGKGCSRRAVRRRTSWTRYSRPACKRCRRRHSSMRSTSRTSTSCRARRSTMPRSGWPARSRLGRRSPRR